MANIKSAKKRIRTIEKKTARNIRVKNHAEAEKAFKHAEKKFMQAAAKGTFHKNIASRTVSRLAKRLNNLKESK